MMIRGAPLGAKVGNILYGGDTNTNSPMTTDGAAADDDHHDQGGRAGFY